MSRLRGTVSSLSYTPVATTGATANSWGNGAAQVVGTAMDGNGGTTDHSFSSGVQDYGACLACHLANQTTIYGTSSVKVNVFHARPSHWFDDGNDTSGSLDDDHFSVLRYAPGRGSFNVFGNDQNYWPLGDLRGQTPNKALCAGGNPYENCPGNQESRGRNWIESMRGDWDTPAAGYGNTITIPCGNWNDNDNFCSGATQSVPHCNGGCP